MPIKPQKEPITARLDADDYAWVERQALVFGDKSTVLNRAVKIIRALIARGILRWEMAELQELLQENRCSFGSASPEKTDRAKRIRPVHIGQIHRSEMRRPDRHTVLLSYRVN